MFIHHFTQENINKLDGFKIIEKLKEFAIKNKEYIGISTSAWSTFYVDCDGNIDTEFENYYNRAVSVVFNKNCI